MKVKELVEILEKVDGNAIVLKEQHFGDFDEIDEIKETQTWIPDRTDSMYGEYACASLECKEDIPAKTMSAVVLD